MAAPDVTQLRRQVRRQRRRSEVLTAGTMCGAETEPTPCLYKRATLSRDILDGAFGSSFAVQSLGVYAISVTVNDLLSRHVHDITSHNRPRYHSTTAEIDRVVTRHEIAYSHRWKSATEMST